MALTVLFQVTSPISFKTPGETISSNSMRKGKESWGSEIKPSSAHLWDSEMDILKKYRTRKNLVSLEFIGLAMSELQIQGWLWHVWGR